MAHTSSSRWAACIRAASVGEMATIMVQMRCSAGVWRPPGTRPPVRGRNGSSGTVLRDAGALADELVGALEVPLQAGAVERRPILLPRRRQHEGERQQVLSRITRAVALRLPQAPRAPRGVLPWSY